MQKSPSFLGDFSMTNWTRRTRESGCFLASRQGLLGSSNQGTKGFVVGNRQFRKHFAVQVYASRFQPAHELAVGDIVVAAGRVDTSNPQRAEVTLLQAATGIGILKCLLQRFLRRSVQLTLGKEKAFCLFENPFPGCGAFRAAFDSGHVLLL